MSVINRLNDHLTVLRTGDISPSTTHRLMALLRELLEQQGINRQYPLVTMFCDWSLHIRLDRSPAGAKLLDLLDATWANSRQVDQQIDALVDQLKPHLLRSQMIDILEGVLIDPTVVRTDELFGKIVRCLITDLVEKPIARKAKDEQKRVAERLALGYRFIAERIQFQEIDQMIQLVLVAKQIAPTVGGEVRIQMPWIT